MALSAEFILLKARIADLKLRFLGFHNSDSLLRENQDRLMSFRLLVHAEIEHFFELHAGRIANHYLNELNTSGTILPGALFLILYSPNKFSSDHFQNVKDRIRVCCQSFIAGVTNNNGVKQKNILQLFLPLGVTESFLDAAWLMTMDSFGARRGSYAHRSFSVQNPVDKDTEINELTIVLTGVKKLDTKLQKLMSSRLRKPF